MSKGLSLLLGSAAALALTLSSGVAQTSVSTDPQGYSTDSVTSGNNIVSPTMVNEAKFEGPMAGIADGGALPGGGDSTTVTQTGAGWTPGEFDEGSSFPTHYIQIVDDPNGTTEGRIFDIVSNTADSLRVAGDLAGGIGLDGNEQYVIRAHVTVGQLFDGSGELLAFVDSITFYEQGGSTTTYLWFGSNFNTGSARPVYPGESFLLTSTTATDVMFEGEVPTSPTYVPVFSGTINFVSVLNPVSGTSTQLGNLDLGANMLAFVDSVTIYSRDGSLTPVATYLWQGVGLGWSGGGNTFEVTEDHTILVSVTGNQNWVAPAAFSD